MNRQEKILELKESLRLKKFQANEWPTHVFVVEYRRDETPTLVEVLVQEYNVDKQLYKIGQMPYEFRLDGENAVYENQGHGTGFDTWAWTYWATLNKEKAQEIYANAIDDFNTPKITPKYIAPSG